MKSPIIILAIILATTAWGAEDDLYNFRWLDPDKKVYVLQNKIYHKRGSLYANIGYLSGLSSNYQDVSGVQLALGFYPFEEWAIELLYHQYHNSDNEDKKTLLEFDNVVPFVRKFNNKMAAVVLWSPFYGKINTFNQIIYLDLSFGLGGGKVQAQSNAETVAYDDISDEDRSESFPMLTLKSALRIYITKYFHAGLEYYRDMYRAGGPVPRDGPKPEEKLRVNNELIFNIGFSF